MLPQYMSKDIEERMTTGISARVSRSKIASKLGSCCCSY